MHELFDRVTNNVAYMVSVLGVMSSSMKLEDWYFFTSILVGVVALIANIWHKRVMQRIAKEKGIFFKK
ncbi:hypothetical protein CZ809_00924 [Photobacterium piscicola]|uniref:Uncharacterized protein n=1 Tax=Photobacterium piscicola TaxID=1378299 RepID=A0A1T5HXM6_9GAMM|nr:hypothetical protein [Photobacterium piscicola]SKC31446.1 hypothetical protein CZ809_00924 [Photobacterium piscicola]